MATNNGPPWINALCKKHNICSTPSNKTKNEILKIMKKACDLTTEKAKLESLEFYQPTLSFKHKTKKKEEVMPDPVPKYKYTFNWQDKFDHYLKSVDPEIKIMAKKGRMTEIAVYVGLVNIWSVCAEQKLHETYASRIQYLTQLAMNKKNHPSETYNIRTYFLVNLRNTFLSLAESESHSESESESESASESP